MRSLLKALPDPVFRNAGPVLLAVLAFALTAIALSTTLRASQPAPFMQVLTPKLEHYEDQHAAYDTIVVGTSRTLYHVQPEAVKTGMAEAGCSGRSVYNFGVFGLRGAELDWLIDQILADDRPSLKTVIMEQPLEPHREFARVTETRGRYFSGPSFFGQTMDAITTHSESAPKKVFRAAIAGYGTVYDLSGVGRAAEIAFPPAETIERDAFSFAEDGFEALDDVQAEAVLARNAAFRADIDAFQGKLDRYRAQPRIGADQSATYMIERLNLFKEAGYQPIFYASPSVDYLDLTPDVADAVSAFAPDLDVLNFNAPDQYPELFDQGFWFDFGHMGRAGAEAFSRQFGEAICRAELARSEGEAIHAVR